MLAARRVWCGRAWSAALVGGSRRPTLHLPSSVVNKASYTMFMGNRTARYKGKAMNGSAYSQSTAGATILTATPQTDSKMLKVQWEGGRDDTYPYLWLRDNCQCSACFHPISQSRRVMLKDLCPSLDCTAVKVKNDGEEIEVYWTNGHTGTYNAQWLYERALRELRQEPRDQDQDCRLPKVYWGHELQEKIHRVSFTELLQSDASLLTFLENLEMLGVVLVTDVSDLKDQIKILSHRIGHLKITPYGTQLNVFNKRYPNNLADTGDSLDLHVDLPYLEHKPGIQLLHCIKQFTGDGGETLLRDGFAAALTLQEKNPKYYDTLVQTMVDFVDVGVEGGEKFDANWRAPVIEVHADGSLRNINCNQMTRDSRFYVSSERAASWYNANLAFRDILYDADGIFKTKLQPGNIVVFDNMRVLHGRQGYRTDHGERFLQAGYWEWDTVRSKRRVLAKET